MIITVMPSCNSLENHTRFQTKMGKFSDQEMRKTKPYPLERHIPKLNYTAYTRDGTPRDLHEVIYCQYHLTIILQFDNQYATTCPLVTIKTLLWKRIPFAKEFFSNFNLSVTLADTYYTRAESRNSWKYKYLYYVIPQLLFYKNELN